VVSLTNITSIRAAEKLTLTPEERCAVGEQPWKQWLEAEMESDSDEDDRPWLNWKPNLEDPSDKPWLHWGDGTVNRDKRADSPEMNGAYPSVDLSRF